MTIAIENVAVAAVDRAAAHVLTLDGQTLPVSDWADVDGQPMEEPRGARFCVAGPDAHGRSWLVDVARLTAKVRRRSALPDQPADPDLRTNGLPAHG